MAGCAGEGGLLAPDVKGAMPLFLVAARVAARAIRSGHRAATRSPRATVLAASRGSRRQSWKRPSRRRPAVLPLPCPLLGRVRCNALPHIFLVDAAGSFDDAYAGLGKRSRQIGDGLGGVRPGGGIGSKRPSSSSLLSVAKRRAGGGGAAVRRWCAHPKKVQLPRGDYLFKKKRRFPPPPSFAACERRRCRKIMPVT